MSNDIPVGSPPVPPGRHAAPGGWYPDPVDPARERYWDGWQWSRNTREAETPPPAPHPGMPAAGQPQPGQPPQQGYPPQPGMPPQQQSYPPQQGYPPQPGMPPQYGMPAVPPGGQPVLRTADGVEVSGWWYRVLAAVIDWLIFTVISGLVSIPIYLRMVPAFQALFEESMRAAEQGRIMPMTDTTQLIPPGDQLLLTVIAIGVGLLYHGFFLRWRGATPGKLVVGLRVVPLDEGRFTGQLPWRAVILRTLIWVLPGVAAVLAIFQLIDVLVPLGHPKKQALHDLAAGTQVIKKVPGT